VKIAHRLFAIFGALVISSAGVLVGASAASAQTSAFSSQSATILQGVPATGNEVTLSGSSMPASFSPANGAVNLTFSEAGLEGYVDSATSTSVTMNIQVEPWVPTGSASVTVSGSDGSVVACTNCLSVTGNSAGWSFTPAPSSEPVASGPTDKLAKQLPVKVCAFTGIGSEGGACLADASQNTIYAFTPSHMNLDLSATWEQGATVSVYGTPDQFEVSNYPAEGSVESGPVTPSGNYVDLTAESTGGSTLPVDPTLNAIVVRNPDGTVAICSDCFAVGSTAPTTSGLNVGYSFDPSPLVQFGSQLLVDGTVTCSTPVTLWMDYAVSQGTTDESVSRWVNCQGATYVSDAVPASGSSPGPVSIAVLVQGYEPQGSADPPGDVWGVDATTTAIYSPPLFIGITLDSTGYRGPGEAIFGATVTCNEAVSGTASVAFTLDGATVYASSAATCGSDGLGYVVFNVPGSWGPGPAGVTASFSADGSTGTTTGVVNIS
jgi:hypothetical protein